MKENKQGEEVWFVLLEGGGLRFGLLNCFLGLEMKMDIYIKNILN